MAQWSLVGIGTVANVASGNISPTLPTGLQEGDLLIAHIAYRSTAAFSAPSGEWTIHQQQSSGNTSTTVGASIGSGLIASCIRGASNPANTFTRTAGDVARAHITAWRNAGAISFVASSSNTLAANSTTVTTAELTTSTGNNLLILGYCGANNVAASAFRAATDPTTQSGATTATTGEIATLDAWVEIYDSGTTSGADTQIALARAAKNSAGATGELRITAGDSNRHVAVAGAWAAAPLTLSIDTDAGSLVLTGYDIASSVAHADEIELASFVLSGYDATLEASVSSINTPIDIDTGTFALTGYDIGSFSTKNYQLETELGAISLTANTIESNISLYEACDNVELSIVGSNISTELSISGTDTPIDINSASYTVTGHNLDHSIAIIINTTTEDYTLNAYNNITSQQANEEISNASFSLAGHDPSFTVFAGQDYFLHTQEPGWDSDLWNENRGWVTFWLNGKNINTSYGYNHSADNALYEQAGNSIIDTAAFTLPAGLADYILTEYSVTTRYSVNISLNTGDFIASFENAGSSFNTSSLLANGSIEIAGSDIESRYAASIVNDSASFVFSTQSIQTSVGVNTSVNTESFAIGVYDISLSANYILLADNITYLINEYNSENTLSLSIGLDSNSYNYSSANIESKSEIYTIVDIGLSNINGNDVDENIALTLFTELPEWDEEQWPENQTWSTIAFVGYSVTSYYQAGGGPNSISADLGIFNLTGNAVQNSISYKATTDIGNFVINEYSISDTIFINISTNTEAYSIDGYDISTQRSGTEYSIATNTGSFTINSNDTSNVITITVNTDTTNYDLSCNSISNIFTSTEILTHENYLTTGKDILNQLTLHNLLDQGNYSFIGYAISSSQEVDGEIVANTGNYVLTNRSTTEKVTLSISVNHGALNFACNDYNSSISVNSVCAKGSMVLSGQTISISQGIGIALEAGAFSVAWQPVVTGSVIVLDRGLMALEGLDAGIALALRQELLAGSISLTGPPAGLSRQYFLEIDKAQYAFSFANILDNLQLTLSNVLGSIDVAGKDVTSSIGKLVLLDRGIFNYSGYSIEGEIFSGTSLDTGIYVLSFKIPRTKKGSTRKKSAFYFAANSTARFLVSIENEQITDANGNVFAKTENLEYELFLSTTREPVIRNYPGINATSTFLTGYCVYDRKLDPRIKKGTIAYVSFSGMAEKKCIVLKELFRYSSDGLIGSTLSNTLGDTVMFEQLGQA